MDPIEISEKNAKTANHNRIINTHIINTRTERLAESPAFYVSINVVTLNKLRHDLKEKHRELEKLKEKLRAASIEF